MRTAKELLIYLINTKESEMKKYIGATNKLEELNDERSLLISNLIIKSALAQLKLDLDFYEKLLKEYKD